MNLNEIKKLYPDFTFKLELRIFKEDKWVCLNIDQFELEFDNNQFNDRLLKPAIHFINKALR